jgi:uncharacterized RDD family membrane protein YckC
MTRIEKFGARRELAAKALAARVDPSVPTQYGSSKVMEYGTLSPWWRRVLAALVDSAVVIAFSSLLLLLVAGRSLSEKSHSYHDVHLLRFLAAFVSVALYYPPLMRWSNGRTLGKALVGIRVAGIGGNPMTLRLAIWREVIVKLILLDAFSSIPSIGMVLGLVVASLDGLWPLWDRKNRALHDRIVHTHVVIAQTRE